MERKEIAAKIIELEVAALEEWNKGNPTPFLDLLSADITYVDPLQENRIDGFARMKDFYEGLRGQVNVSHYEMIDPVVQINANVAVLSYRLDSYSGDILYKWNCTEVYCQDADNRWRIIHTHWSFVRPMEIKKEIR
ncbi:MAG: nuclear transport factor 2 family protein [Candidatus Azobacteroides sp.]|nr:nuclear transport factor 2 family protein [Candidatus Azobacteroides sp.]